MADTECTHCGRWMCGNCYHVYWSDDGPFCCEEHAKIFAENKRINAEEANSAARREMSGAKW